MRRRVPEPERFTGEVPPELRVGALIEVWAADDRSEFGPHFGASRRYRHARQRWAESSSLSRGEEFRRLPSSVPWSFRFLVAEGRRDEAGVTEADLPALRAAAEAWPPDWITLAGRRTTQ